MPKLFGGKASYPGHKFEDGIFLLYFRFRLDNGHNAFPLCGHQSLLVSVISVPSFDLRSCSIKLTGWELLFSFC